MIEKVEEKSKEEIKIQEVQENLRLLKHQKNISEL